MSAGIFKRLTKLEARTRVRKPLGGVEIWQLNEDGTYTNERVTLTAEEFEQWTQKSPADVFIIDDIPRTPNEEPAQ